MNDNPYTAHPPKIGRLSSRRPNLIARPVAGDANPEGKAATRRRLQAERDALRKAAREARQAAERDLLVEFATTFTQMADLATKAAESMIDMQGALQVLSLSLAAIRKDMHTVQNAVVLEPIP